MRAFSQIQAATPADAPGIVEVMRDSFAPAWLRLILYGCPGMAVFVGEQIAVQDLGGDTHYTVARQQQDLVGCVELRRYLDGLFLNYIAVRPSFRSCGVAKHLLRTALELAGTEQQATLSLDVLELNTVARHWYEQLGFRDQHCTTWWTMPLVAGSEAPVLLNGFAQAQVCQQTYGFSRFQLITSRGSYEVGRMGGDWFRLTAVEAVEAPGLRSALHRLDPGRQILLVAAGNNSPPGPGAQAAVRMWRMSVALDTLRPRLRGQQTTSKEEM